MGFLNDYIYYSSGNETPEEYLYWGGLNLLGHILGRKVWVEHGDYFKFPPNLYNCLVGDAGSGKNTCLGVNQDIMVEHFPNLMLSASVQSREDIALQMATDSDTNPKTWKAETGHLQAYRPFYILNDELNNFLSVDKVKMMQFLIQVFDGKRFSTGFKKDRIENPGRKQWFENPHVSMIAGAVPEWFMANLKLDLFSSGMGRRMIIVVGKKTKVIPFPRKPVGADAAMSRVIEHLKEADAFSGAIRFDDTATKWWEPWYKQHYSAGSIPNDPILSQFHATKPMQTLKVATILKMTERPFDRKLGADHLQAALELVTRLETPILKLTSGIGRNELAGVGSQLIDFIERTGGMQTEVNVLKYFRRFATSPEFLEIVNSYVKTGELIVAQANKDGVTRTFYFTPDGYQHFEKMRQEQGK